MTAIRQVKEVFGGAGMNLINPAMAARAFLFFTYPMDMSGDAVWSAAPMRRVSTAIPAPPCRRSGDGDAVRPDRLPDQPMVRRAVLVAFRVGKLGVRDGFHRADPVTSAFTDAGEWVYGDLIGALIVLVRVVNPAYPDSMMLVIPFMNVMAPTIEYFIVRANIRKRRPRNG